MAILIMRFVVGVKLYFLLENYVHFNTAMVVNVLFAHEDLHNTALARQSNVSLHIKIEESSSY